MSSVRLRSSARTGAATAAAPRSPERRMPDPSGNRRLDFRAFQGRRGLEELSSTWMALAESLPGARFVHFPGWYRAYLSSLEADAQRVWFVAAYRDEALVGILPLHFHAYALKGMHPEVFGTI